MSARGYADVASRHHFPLGARGRGPGAGAGAARGPVGGRSCGRRAGGAIPARARRSRRGLLTAFVLYLRQFFEPMQDLSQFYNVFQAAGAALEKLAGVIEERPTVPEPATPVHMGAINGALAVEHVTVAYRDKAVLHDIDLR